MRVCSWHWAAEMLGVCLLCSAHRLLNIHDVQITWCEVARSWSFGTTGTAWLVQLSPLISCLPCLRFYGTKSSTD